VSRTSPTKAPASKTKARAEAPKKSARGKGLSLDRRFTERGTDPLDGVVWERRSSVITNPDGSCVF